jgi:uncharacterized integral membrane protein
MTLLRWIVGGILFLVLLLFALQNVDVVTLRFFDVGTLDAPLIFLLLLAFAVGVALGLLASAVRIVRLSREVARLRKAAPTTLQPVPAPHGAAPDANAPAVPRAGLPRRT